MDSDGNGKICDPFQSSIFFFIIYLIAFLLSLFWIIMIAWNWNCQSTVRIIRFYIMAFFTIRSSVALEIPKDQDHRNQEERKQNLLLVPWYNSSHHPQHDSHIAPYLLNKLNYTHHKTLRMTESIEKRDLNAIVVQFPFFVNRSLYENGIFQQMPQERKESLHDTKATRPSISMIAYLCVIACISSSRYLSKKQRQGRKNMKSMVEYLEYETASSDIIYSAVPHGTVDYGSFSSTPWKSHLEKFDL